jgi:hypothetical protein
LLFQDDFSGRAEIGLTGDDDFHIKVSADGSAWIDAMLFDRASGAAKINAGLFLTGSLTPALIAADQDDYNPPNLAGASVLRLSSDAARDIGGLSGGGDGRLMVLVNAGANPIRLKDASAASSPENRFAFGADITLAVRQSAALWYDAAASGWRLLAGPASGAGGGSGPADLELTLALQQMQIADNSGAALFHGSAGNRFADSFRTLTYVDTAGAANLDSSKPGLLKPTQSGGTDQSTSGQAISGGDSSSGLRPKGDAFDNDANTRWGSFQTDASVAGVAYIGQDFGSGNAKHIRAITIRQRQDNDSAQVSSVKVQYSDDGSGWTEEGTYALTTAVNAGVETINLSATGAHRYWRILANANTQSSGGWEWQIEEITMSETATINSLAVASTALTAASPPLSANLVVRYKPVDAITLGTDLIFEVSRDGGVTWTAATMTDRFISPSPVAGVHVLEGAADLTSQPSGASMKWRARSANNKRFELHDMSLRW